ncbi:MAG TPA: hypothetical protein VF723_03405 [Pyrinomonadaceae bacterium]|jgi:hypothetical protein
MAGKLSVIFYIILCLEVGLVLTLLPWCSPFGLGEWGDNYFLLYAAQKTGLQSLQYAVASGWVRGAVTGLGLLNLGIAVWEITHFSQTVRALQGLPPVPHNSARNGAQSSSAHHLPDYERRDDGGGQQSGQ